jgi:riboflavin synthase
MFSGIVEEAGEVVRVTEREDGIRLAVRAPVCSGGARLGDSIAVNGCCLTVLEAAGDLLAFDLLRETWNRTNLRFATPGSVVNLERSLPANGRLHGHFVTGHIDGTGRVRTLEKRDADWYLEIDTPPEIFRYIVFKGAVAVDGVSLTVAEVGRDSFALWIIPHTWAVTALRERKAGDVINLEADILAKYVEKLCPVAVG